MSTDHAWVRWGQQDPYFAVITDPRYRNAAITEDARREFFATGEQHARWLLDMARRHVSPAFAPRRALDFGCGVGRVAVPLATLVPEVVGVDVSPAMLEEAARNADRRRVTGTRWVVSDDTLSRVDGRFDLVHSCIVFQHIDVPRGRALFERLVRLVAPGGVGAIQITYAKSRHAATWGQPPAPPPAPARASHAGGDPEMQMNAYPLGELAFIVQRSGVRRMHVEFTDHGGELGVFLFFGRDAEAA